MLRRIFVPFLLWLALWARLEAAVDLVTLPTREGTQLTIYNSEDITMVREHRLLTVKEGINRIQFSWANTLIDPTSIEFRILDQQDKVDLADTTFPAGRNDALQWNIKSQIAGKIPVEIRYFTSGITWAMDYVGIANEDETKINLTGYVRVSNNSGELYDNAQTRLVVGKINLVEKIADLARRQPPGQPRMGLAGALHDAMNDAVVIADTRTLELKTEAPKEVIKQGLSEYFLFTIDGREDIKDKEPKRMVAMKVAEVPLESIYKLTDRSSDQGFTKFYRFKNLKLLDDQGKEKKLSTMENLGLSPLPNGTVRLFSEYKNRDLAYVGGTETKYVPIGDRVEVTIEPPGCATTILRSYFGFLPLGTSTQRFSVSCGGLSPPGTESFAGILPVFVQIGVMEEEKPQALDPWHPVYGQQIHAVPEPFRSSVIGDPYIPPPNPFGLPPGFPEIFPPTQPAPPSAAHSRPKMPPQRQFKAVSDIRAVLVEIAART
jgi:hypothetical protein